MKHMIGAVYGHYDSRGGTMFLEMREQTDAERQRVNDEYDSMFAWPAMIEEAKRAKQDGKPWDWDPEDYGSRPSNNNFMYLARLSMPDDVEVERIGDAADMTLGGTDLETIGAVVFSGDDNEDDYTDAQRDSTANVPLLEMEFVPMPDGRYGFDDGDDAAVKYVRGHAQTHAGKTCEDVPCWNDDAYGFVVIPAGR